MHVQSMLASHPAAGGRASDRLIACIQRCLDCGQACTACADACLAEQSVAELRRCIRLDLDCADLCLATARIAGRQTSRQGSLLLHTLEACAEACRVCGEECERHAGMHAHCRICANACRACEQACREALTDTPLVQ